MISFHSGDVRWVGPKGNACVIGDNRVHVATKSAYHKLLSWRILKNDLVTSP